jgi:hypothetical protein
MSAMPPPVPPQRTDARDQAPQERRDEGDADRDEAHEIEDACQSASDEPRERQVEQGGEEAATDVVEVADQPWNPRVVDTGDAGPGCRVARTSSAGRSGNGGSVGSVIGGSFRRGRVAPG